MGQSAWPLSRCSVAYLTLLELKRYAGCLVHRRWTEQWHVGPIGSGFRAWADDLGVSFDPGLMTGDDVHWFERQERSSVST